MSRGIDVRLARIYAAIGETATTDPAEFKHYTFQKPDGTYVIGMDFQGELSAEQMLNQLYSAIHNVANLRDHLKSWARKNGADAVGVEQAIARSRALQVTVDLSNEDKHGPERDGGRSKLNPRLENISRALVLGGGTGKGGSFSATIVPFGESSFEISEGSEFVVNAEVLSEAGDRIGDLRSLLGEAIAQWEELFNSWPKDRPSAD